MLQDIKAKLPHRLVKLTDRQRRFLINVIEYELNLVVQLPDRKIMKPHLKIWLNRFNQGLNTLDLAHDRVGKVGADGEFLVDVREYRLYHVYNMGDWHSSENAVYKQLIKKLSYVANHQPSEFRMEV